jgi:hypothetical protein
VAQTGNLTRDFPVKYVCILSFYQILMFAQLDSATPHAIVFVFFFYSYFRKFPIYAHHFYNDFSRIVLFRYAIQGVSARRKEDEDADRHLAQWSG